MFRRTFSTLDSIRLSVEVGDGGFAIHINNFHHTCQYRVDVKSMQTALIFGDNSAKQPSTRNDIFRVYNIFEEV